MKARMEWHQIPGAPAEFDFRNFYEAAVREAPDVAVFVEVGVAFGRSTAFLASESERLQKEVRIVAVDNFSSSRGATATSFRAAMRQCGFGNVALLERDAAEAAEQFPDESVHLVFLDADHSRYATEAAIRAWLPKIAKGGVLAGHDYNMPEVAAAVDHVLGTVSVVGYCFVFRR